MSYVRLREQLSALLNTASAENASNTPDFILADYLTGCLESFDKAVKARDSWYGLAPHPNNPFQRSTEPGS